MKALAIYKLKNEKRFLLNFDNVIYLNDVRVNKLGIFLSLFSESDYIFWSRNNSFLPEALECNITIELIV